MDFAKYVREYEELLKEFMKTPYFGHCAISHILKSQELKDIPIRSFYLKNSLVYARNYEVARFIDITKDEHPQICGGVTEYLTKIKLARKLGKSLTELHFFDDVDKPEYSGLSDEELAFAMYEPDIRFRSGYGYTAEILSNKNNIINKASYLAKVALELINKTFPIINEIDFHPQGHVMYGDKLAIKGDSDLAINNCLIDFKLTKNQKLSNINRAQLFAYALHKHMRDGVSYDRVYFINPRAYLLEELVLKS